MKIDGLPVKDADGELKIKVLPRDIKAGAAKNSNFCAAARALIREGQCQEAKVHIGRTYLRQGDQWVRYKTSKPLRTEVIAFDRGGAFEPGEYTLLPIPEIDRSENRSAARKSNKTKRASHANKGIRKQHVATGIRKRMEVG